ncbi:unnamed protein product [Ambrosiozyma monospora]|uniref:Unnamed protein product n=1 Tax=Ambrosiozyma monospora TaxID=43982 RepID=A0A9W6T9W6_AMBMO|nr:unnamed protein product [Ambrosiozyma monospora]
MNTVMVELEAVATAEAVALSNNNSVSGVNDYDDQDQSNQYDQDQDQDQETDNEKESSADGFMLDASISTAKPFLPSILQDVDEGFQTVAKLGGKSGLYTTEQGQGGNQDDEWEDYDGDDADVEDDVVDNEPVNGNSTFMKQEKDTKLPNTNTINQGVKDLKI